MNQAMAGQMMGSILPEKEVVIDGHTYVMTMLGAVVGRKIWVKLLQTMAGPMQKLASFNTMDEHAMVGAFGAALDSLDPEVLESLYAAFGKACRVRLPTGKEPSVESIFDTHFAGRYVAMSQWVGENILFNYAGFLGDMSIGQIIAKVQVAVKKVQSKSPKVSTGSSGES